MDEVVPHVDCRLELQVGDQLVKLECTCHPGAKFQASNALMIEMYDRIRAARSRELAGQTEVAQ